MGIENTFTDFTDLELVKKGLRKNTKVSVE